METEVVALILSSSISIISVISAAATAIYQQYNQRKTKIMEMYFEAQLKTYTDFYTLIVGVDSSPIDDNLDKIAAAAKAAEILSPQDVAKIINEFCKRYFKYKNEVENNGYATKETLTKFYDAIEAVEKAMREELMRHDTYKRKYLKKVLKDYRE